MLVYGNRRRLESAAAMLCRLRLHVAELAEMPPGILRHEALVAAFILAGELAQGLADHAFVTEGSDAPRGLSDAAMVLLQRLAAAVLVSWRSNFAELPKLADCELPGMLPTQIETRQAEGFAFYAVYPESYAQAALDSALGPDTMVIGLRSIGTPLAAMVAATLEAPAPVTLRPIGHPWQRRLAMTDALAERLLHASSFAIVDEGPGLSGSSMGAVADYLEDSGIPPGQIRFFPSHGGDAGARASTRHRIRWNAAQRHVGTFDAVLLPRLASWVADLTGPAEGTLQDISGGAWRRGAEAGWPPAAAGQERRKFLLAAGARQWLLKFIGLGEIGRRKAAMAQTLSDAGFVPGFAGHRHGFSVEQWVTDVAAPRALPGMTQHVARYLAFRARHFPIDQGATLARLWEMARHNVTEHLGADAARALLHHRFDTEALQLHVSPVAIDGRMHEWEWLSLSSGMLLKTDAVDHHDSHDLIGGQDLAWDVAGAEVELGLDGHALRRAIEGAGGPAILPELQEFYRPCYLAFQMGYYVMAAGSCADWPAEATRLTAQAEHYAAALRKLL